MSFTTADVVKLRKVSGAGMMDCKNALKDAEGDFDRALEIIREKGKLIANKRADRDAAEGVAIAKVTADAKFGAIVVLNCETDFVAKNETFVSFAEKIMEAALENKVESLEALKAIEINGVSIEAMVTEQTGVTGEKLDLSYFKCLADEAVVPYIHPGNKLATLVSFNKTTEEQVGKDVAMQIAAMAPVAIDEASIPQAEIDKELAFAKEKYRNEGKPEAMIEKIALGSLNKWYKDVTLLNQAYVKDNKMSIKDFLKQNDAELTVTAFDRYSLDA
ncbi:translation elongation factor Ts [Prolixibacteraceae bacterium Z1-6]|uniref:Elongation factor Ts n=1 Tax=Draconibacterium aestuarii TaxID=2998507 RepID=A0A9X3F4M3_9BACT|nr:translation elongation factor Ts [Prolixibacteraceae bacterium Z1-6]